MAAVTVFVDDAVLGRLPYLCVKTGAPAEGLLTVRKPVGDGTRLGVWWLLVLAGPLGWLALLFIAWASNDSREMLTIQVPWTEAAQHEHDLAKQTRRKRWLACLVLFGLATIVGWTTGDVAVGNEMAGVLLVAAIAVGLSALWAGLAVERTMIEVQLDASRRWVVLGNVHRDFAHTLEIGRSYPFPAAP